MRSLTSQNTSLEQRVQTESTPPLVSAAHPEQAGDLALIRRLDWRFLLPDARLRNVALIGSSQGEMAQALRRFSERVTFLADAQSNYTGGELDLVVATRPSADVIRRAAGLLQARGIFYGEFTRPWASRAARRSASAITLERALLGLREVGFGNISLHWHLPDFEACSHIIPGSDRAALFWALDRSRGNITNVARASLLRFAERIGVLPRLVPCVSVVAQRLPSSNVVQEFLLERGEIRAPFLEQADLPACSWLLPRYARSGHAIALLRTQGQLTAVAKVARLPETGERLRREARVLDELQRHSISGVPRVLALAEFRGSTILLETALAGQLLDANIARRDPDGCTRLVQRWLEQLHSATASPSTADPGWSARLIDAPLASLETLLATRPSALTQLRQTGELLRRLSFAEIPLVLAHGDFSAPNLLIQADGKCAVLDWETAEQRSLPLSDVLFFLTFIAFARHRASRPAEFAAAYRQDISSPSGWARPYLSGYCAATNIATSLVPLLALACITRYLSHAGQDLLATGTPAEVATILTGSRFYHVWKVAIEAAARVL